LYVFYGDCQNTVFDSATVKCTSMVRNVWVCHAVADYVHVTEDKDVQLKFLIQHTNSDPPQDLLNAGMTGKPCTVEFLTKLLPDRYNGTDISSCLLHNCCPYWL